MMMENQNIQMPVSVLDDLQSMQDFTLSQINLLNSEAECTQLKKALEKAQSKIIRLKKEIQEILESKIQMETKSNSARRFIQRWIGLKDGSLNNGKITIERFKILRMELETRKYVEKESTPPLEPLVGETESIPAVKTKFNDVRTVAPEENSNISVIRCVKRRTSLPPAKSDVTIKKRQRKSKPEYDKYKTTLRNRNIKTLKKCPKPGPVSRKTPVLQPVPLTPKRKIGETNVSKTSETNSEFVANVTNANKPKILAMFVEHAEKSTTMSTVQNETENLDDGASRLSRSRISKRKAVEFVFNALQMNSVDNNVDDVIQRLCERLQCDPLAMQLAVAYIKENLLVDNCQNLKEAIESYLKEIENETKLHAHKLPDYYSPTYLTWKVTFDKLQNAPDVGEKCLKIMQIISVLSPDNISLEFVSCLYNNIENCAMEENILRVLKNHSMLDYCPGEQISVHRIVQELTRIYLTDQGEFLNILSRVIDGVNKMLKENEVTLDQLIHAQTIWEHAENKSVLIEKHKIFPVFISKKFLYSEKYKQAYDFSCKALHTLNKILGEDDKVILYLTYWKGKALKELGRYSESLKLLTEVYEKQKKLFGEEDWRCLWIADDIAYVHSSLKNNEEAIKWFENALEKSERLNGREHSQTLSLKKGLAMVLDKQGKYEESTEMYQEVLDGEERETGIENPDTLTTKSNLACVRFEKKEYEDALRMFQEVLEVEERVFARNRPDIWNTKGWIAYTYESLGRIKESFQLAKEVYKMRIKILGRKHRHTIEIKNLVSRTKPKKEKLQSQTVQTI